ncbi:hypothetical protein [Streptomyces prunicolor]|uniref:hypothetical protein n=1 Tax=Streptomyces prunicolor TaxID=67348 RepID=UPI0003700590|nr:hypothetical protein [Streptomyces prunicolor]
MRGTKTMAEHTGPIVAGTVGDDVLTVHKLRVLDESAGSRRAVCDAGKPGDVTDEWARTVNCPECLAIDTE